VSLYIQLFKITSNAPGKKSEHVPSRAPYKGHKQTYLFFIKIDIYKDCRIPTTENQESHCSIFCRTGLPYNNCELQGLFSRIQFCKIIGVCFVKRSKWTSNRLGWGNRRVPMALTVKTRIKEPVDYEPPGWNLPFKSDCPLISSKPRQQWKIDLWVNKRGRFFFF
jgi:hypothetical protein